MSYANANESLNSTVPCSKRKYSGEEVQVDLMSSKMMPSLFLECHPISNIGDIDGVLREPPKWVDRVEPLLLRLDGRTVPKTLVCHDYKGGYQADKYLHFANENIVGNGYTFYNWAQIDVFVYFSHHFITIPPLCWINAGHRNGVKVLGTLITEFGPGANLCDTNIFKNMESMRSFAESVAQLTKIFGFDGWLLNIENNVKNYAILKEFVVYFTELVHSYNPRNLVIWYDSVTDKGELNWQNELNEKNRFYFDSCDAIFLNYTWSEKNLIASAEAAQHRNLDVFVGIDVFGRNMFGGGKFNTYKAVEMVTRYNLSMAIFAPGWTHETLERSEKFFEEFLSRDSAFWSSLWSYLYTHPISNHFTTNFYIGLDKSCYNIFNQQQQLSKFLHPKEITIVPDHQNIPTLYNKCNCIQAVTIGSRNTCLITRRHLRSTIEYVHHLFACDLSLTNNTVVYFFTKYFGEISTALTVTLLVSGINGSCRKIRLLGRKKDNPVSNSSMLEINQTDASDVYDSLRNRYRHMVENEQWCLSIYVFNTPSCNIMEVGGTVEGAILSIWVHLELKMPMGTF